jgi:hypothetical protein
MLSKFYNVELTKGIIGERVFVKESSVLCTREDCNSLSPEC